MSARASGFLLASLLVARAAPGAAEPPGQAQVSVDWTRVADADVARCGLARLRAGTIERLVSDGHAAVDEIDDRGVAVAVASVPGGLRIEVVSGELARDETLAIPEGCDATFVLDVISRIAELVGEVARSRPPPPAPDVEPAGAAAPSSPTSRLLGSVELALRVSSAGDLLVGGGFGARLRWPAGFEAGLRLALSGNETRGVRVLEGFAGVTGAWQPSPRGLGLYLELGPAVHAASSSQQSVSEPDAFVAAGLQLGFGHLLAHLLVQARLRRIEHRVGDEKAFDTGYLGVVGRIGGQLPGL